MNCKRILHHQINSIFYRIQPISRYSSKKMRGHQHTLRNSTHRKLKNKFKNESNDVLLKTEVLYGRSVCNIALKMSRRSVFRLHLLKSWSSSKIQDKKVEEIIEVAQGRRIAVDYHVRNELDVLSNGEPHQGVCLEVGEYITKNFDESEISSYLLSSKKSSHPLWILLSGILDPRNMGAILRSCFYFDVDRVLIDKRCAPISPVVSKASCGAAEILDLFSINGVENVIEALKTNNWDVIGTVANYDNISDTMQPLEELSAVRLDKPSLIIFGNEGDGIPDHVISSCTRLFTISCQKLFSNLDRDKRDLRSMIGCLNVSNAAAVTLYELDRRRLKAY